VERLSGEHMGRVSSIRQVAIASLVGTALEWYDYFLYGTAAALIFNE
jgi:MFS transporter, MHS family, shikimate and dehydroshikimate transport protein